MKKVLLAVVTLTVLVFPSLAQASWVDDNFDDNSMDTTLWTAIMRENEEGGAKDQLSFPEQNQRLEWITDSEWTDGSNISGGYSSKWAFVLDQDFEVQVDFHYDHTADFDSDEGAVILGFFNPAGGAYITAQNYWEDFYQAGGLTIPETEWERTLLSGELSAKYNVLEDNLYLSASEGEPVIIPGLKSSGINELNVWLAGMSGGAKLNGYDAYFDNFTVTKGHIVPEPTSSVLFLLGGAVFAVRRFRQKIKG